MNTIEIGPSDNPRDSEGLVGRCRALEILLVGDDQQGARTVTGSQYGVSS
jgi:hypothetical protein